MGFEYKFKLTDADKSCFETDVRGHTLDAVLRGGPGYLENDGVRYSYRDPSAPETSRASTVHLEPDGLELCIYNRSSDSNDNDLFVYLMFAILDICCKLEVVDS